MIYLILDFIIEFNVYLYCLIFLFLAAICIGHFRAVSVLRRRSPGLTTHEVYAIVFALQHAVAILSITRFHMGSFLLQA